jgi:chorismate mutase
MGVTGGGVTVVVVGQDDTSKVFDQIEDRMRRAAVPAADLGKKLGDGMGHAVPQVAAASAAIRLFEGQIPIRAVERLITMVPGLGAALQVAFPVVGGIVFGEMVLENINKLRQMQKEALTAGQRSAEAFAQLHDKMQVTITDLELTSSKLQDEIDKLSGHPNNGLATALLEAKKAADQLLTSLNEDRKELEALLKEHSVGILQSIFTGVAATGKQELEIKADGEKLAGAVRTANAAYEKALTEAGGDASKIEAATTARNQSVKKSFQDQINLYVAEAARLRKEERDSKTASDRMAATGLNPAAALARRVDNSARIANVEGVAQQLRDRLQSEVLDERISGQRVTVGALKGNKEGDEVARKAEELRRQRQEADAKFAESMVKLQQAGADESLRQARGRTDQEMAVLDASHKMKLVSDEEYYRQRLAIEERYDGTQLGAANVRRAAINTQIGGLEGQTFSGPDAAAKRVERDAKVNDLMAERLKIAGQIATIEADSAKKRIDAEAQILESHRRDAEDNYSRASTVLDAGRNNVAFRQRRGLISAGDARTQNQAIDAQQADELQRVVDAYQQLADISDDDTAASANAKIAQLKEQILELRNPIDESTEALRTGFDNAFEGLFENVDQGTKSIENFAKSIQRTLTQQVYKELIQPQIDGVLRQAAGSVSGAIRPQGKLPSGVDLSSVVRPVVPSGAAGILGDLTGDKGTTSHITIVLQQDATGAAKVADVFADGNNRDHIIATVADNIGSGGILRQLLGHGL